MNALSQLALRIIRYALNASAAAYCLFLAFCRERHPYVWRDFALDYLRYGPNEVVLKLDCNVMTMVAMQHL